MFKLGFIFLLWGIFTRLSTGSKGCGANQWQCADSSCIFLIGRCDNFPDCPDESDEEGCVSVVCNEGQRPCSSGECINANNFCDGVIHCKDAADELAADCQGVILTSTQKSAIYEDSLSKSKYTVPQAYATDQYMKSTTTRLLPPVPVTFKPGRSVATRSPWLPYITTLSIQNVTTTKLISTTSTEKQFALTKWKEHAVMDTPDKAMVTTEQHPPSIVVPLQTHRPVQSPVEWLTDWFQKIEQSGDNPSKLSPHVPRKTSRITKPYIPSTDRPPYWFDVYNSTYQPTTVKSPCIMVEDIFDFCRRRYRGYYRHPSDCTQYIVCEWSIMHICTCPSNTHWDLRVITCVWKYVSPCITGQYESPVLPDQTTSIASVPDASTIPTTSPIATATPSPSSVTRAPDITSNAFVQPPIRLRTLPSTAEFVTPPVHVRPLPSTPAWLKELSETGFLRPFKPSAPLYQSLLTRFFKAVPSEITYQNAKINK